jgi:hypothetical protein
MEQEDQIVELKLHPQRNQQLIQKSNARFKVIVAGRRFGKTIFAINELIRIALDNPNSRNYYVAPTYRQAKEIAWKMLFEFIPDELISSKNEVELNIELIQGATIALRGADNPESLKGVGLNFAVLDEYGAMKESVWDEVIRPMLIDSKGKAIFIGTPTGYNHFWKLYNKEKDDPDYKSFHFKTIDNLAIDGMPEEVEKARQEMDPIKFSQEIEANFEALVGRPRFDHIVLKEMISRIKAPTRGDLVYENGEVSFQESEKGVVEVYTMPNDATKCVIGVDIAEGIGNDRSSASVINLDTLTEDVVVNTAKMDPAQFAAEMWKLGHWCNKALIAVENNGPGLACILPLRNGHEVSGIKYSAYKNIYYKEVLDEQSKKLTKKFGWHTDSKTKPIIIDKLAQMIRENTITIPGMDTIRELQTYIIEEDGKTNAVEGCTDDRVMALAIAVMMFTLRPKVEIPMKAPEAEKLYG